MRTVFYWPWEWTARVWGRMLVCVAMVAFMVGFNAGFTALEHYLLREYGIAHYWGYAPLLWAVCFFGGFAVAINFGVNTIGVAEEEAKKRLVRSSGFPATR